MGLWSLNCLFGAGFGPLRILSGFVQRATWPLPGTTPEWEPPRIGSTQAEEVGLLRAEDDEKDWKRKRKVSCRLSQRDLTGGLGRTLLRYGTSWKKTNR